MPHYIFELLTRKINAPLPRYTPLVVVYYSVTGLPMLCEMNTYATRKYFTVLLSSTGRQIRRTRVPMSNYCSRVTFCLSWIQSPGKVETSPAVTAAAAPVRRTLLIIFPPLSFVPFGRPSGTIISCHCQ